MDAKVFTQLELRPWKEPRAEEANSGLSVPMPECGPVLLHPLRDSMDTIWANLLLKSETRPNTVLICGSSRNEGNTFVAFNLSTFLAIEFGLKVLYVEAGLDYPPKSQYLTETEGLPGLSTFVLQNQSISSIVFQTHFPNLFVVPAGPQASRRRYGALIHQKGVLREFMTFCREHFDVTIIDGQALSLAPSSVEFARIVDHVVLTIRYGFSRREVCQLAIDKLEENGITQISAVLNEREYPVPARLYSSLK
jgi:Mrp family chromosome partitioning ATPase